MRTVLNRVLLGTAGLLLLAGGAAVLAGGLDLPRHWGFGAPSWWPYRGPHDALLGAVTRMRHQAGGGWWAWAAGVSAVLVAGAAVWLVAQFRAARVRRLRPAEGVVLRGRALEDALAADAGEIDGVSRAAVLLTGRSAEPRARIWLDLDASADPEAVVATLEREVLAEGRRSAGLPALPAEARLGGERHRARRVR